MANKWMKQLQQMEGAVDRAYNPFAVENVLRCKSPSLNWIFGKGSGLPFGYSAVLFGQPKAGKSILVNTFVGSLHAQDKDAICVKFNTEMRDNLQLDNFYGIDLDRYMAYDVNEPELIFDRIKKELLPMIQDGCPIKLIIIDSLKGISGTKEQNRGSINDHLIGDHAKTVQDGLKSILPVIRRNKIALLCTEQVRANQQAMAYGPKEKMAGGYGERHYFEYYIEVKKDGSAEGKANISGEKFESEIKDFKGNKDITGHKIFIKMSESSVGVAGRTGQFTLDFQRGIVGQEEELYTLSKNLKIVDMPNNRTYTYGDKKYSSKQEFAEALKDPILANEIANKIYESNN